MNRTLPREATGSRHQIRSFSGGSKKWPERATAKLPTSNYQLPNRVELNGRVIAGCVGPSQWEPKKPFDLRERLFEFGPLVIRVVQFLHIRGPIGVAVSYRELKECRWRMRLMQAAGILTRAQDPVIGESDELVRIVSTIIRNAKNDDS